MTVTFGVRNLGLTGALKQVSELRTITDKTIILDFQQMWRVRSAGMIFFVSAVEEMTRRGWTFHCVPNATYWNDFGHHAVSYAGGIGFFDALGLDKGNRMGDYVGSTNYCPIRRINQSDLLSNTMIVQEGIVQEAGRLSQILTRDIPQAEKTMQYLIREIMRNTFEHTVSDHIWIAPQRHDTEGKIEVAIADNAQGIRQVISVNPDLKGKILNDEIALRYAVKPGVSGNAKFSKRSDSWANSGYGLYVTAEVLNQLGSFVLISGDSYLKYEHDLIETGDASYQGTAVILEFEIDKTVNLNPDIVRNIVEVGQKKALEDSDAVKVASKASQVL